MVLTRDDPRRRLTATASGRIDTAACEEFVRTARVGDLRTYTVLIDARAATFDITADDLRVIIMPLIQRFRTTDGDRAPVALVVGDADALRKAKVFEILLSAQPGVAYFGMFREVEAAEAWLTSMRDPRR